MYTPQHMGSASGTVPTTISTVWAIGMPVIGSKRGWGTAIGMPVIGSNRGWGTGAGWPVLCAE